MISKKAKAYEAKAKEEDEERQYMSGYNKCPHCLGKVEMVDVNEADYNLECQGCRLKR